MGSAESSEARRVDEGVGGSAIGRAVAALEAVARTGETISLGELSLQLALPKTTVHRIMSQLEGLGLVLRDASGRRYRLAARARALALDVMRTSGRVSGAQVILTRLVDEIGESCNFGVLDGTEIVYVERVECNWPLRTHFAPGSRVPMHCTAIGKLFLAFAPEKQRKRLLDVIKLTPFTGRSFTDRAAFERHLETIRDEGVAYNDQEFMVGLIGVGVPILAPTGEMVAGVALHAPVPRLDIVQARRHVPALHRAAGALARAMEEE